ncbi:MAG: hypothetical protein ACLQSR_17940 [Limisphaerales bacterium]
MAEFNFSCPQCGRQIQCDTGYSGKQINCPVCQKPVVVPPSVAPPGEPIIQLNLKVSTLRKVAIVGLCLLLMAGIGASALYAFGTHGKLTFKAYVDGTDIIKLNGKKLWIEHQEWQLPNQITVNGKKWNPEWNQNTSAPYSLSRVFNQRNLEKIKLTKVVGRGTISIMELPKPANQETLSIKVDDGPFGGADWYEFVVSW